MRAVCQSPAPQRAGLGGPWRGRGGAPPAPPSLCPASPEGPGGCLWAGCHAVDGVVDPWGQRPASAWLHPPRPGTPSAGKAMSSSALGFSGPRVLVHHRGPAGAAGEVCVSVCACVSCVFMRPSCACAVCSHVYCVFERACHVCVSCICVHVSVVCVCVSAFLSCVRACLCAHVCVACVRLQAPAASCAPAVPLLFVGTAVCPRGLCVRDSGMRGKGARRGKGLRRWVRGPRGRWQCLARPDLVAGCWVSPLGPPPVESGPGSPRATGQARPQVPAYPACGQQAARGRSLP